MATLMYLMIYLINQVGRWIWISCIPFQLSFKLGWVWETAIAITLLLIVWMGSSRIILLVSKADHGILIFLPQTDCGRQNWRFFWRFC